MTLIGYPMMCADTQERFIGWAAAELLPRCADKPSVAHATLP